MGSGGGGVTLGLEPALAPGAAPLAPVGGTSGRRRCRRSPIVGWLVRRAGSSQEPEPELAGGGAEDEVPAPTEGSGKTGGVRARSRAGGYGVGSLLARGGIGGGEMVPEAEPAPAPSNLMGALRQRNNEKANKKFTKT